MKTFDWWPRPEKTLVELAQANKARRRYTRDHIGVLIDTAARQAAEVEVDIALRIDQATLSTAISPPVSGFKAKSFEEIKEAMTKEVQNLLPWEPVLGIKLADNVAEWTQFEADFGGMPSIISKPEGSKSAINAKPGEAPSFIPDVRGTYRIKVGSDD